MSDLNYYKSLAYTRRVEPRTEGGEHFFVAWIEELNGLVADGETREEAFFNLSAAFEDYIEAMLEWGREIPEPVLWPARYQGGVQAADPVSSGIWAGEALFEYGEATEARDRNTPELELAEV